MGKILQTLGYGALAIIGLFVVLLLFSSLMIATDLTKQELIDKYANEKSFFYFLPSGAEVHIRDQGNKDKPPLFLLHGSNASLHTWEPLVAQLKDDYRLISFDLPGHGLTGATPQEDYSNIAMANFTREVIELYDFKSVTLVGNSMGGGVALRYALMHPREVDALVLVSSGGMERDENDSSVGAFALVGSDIALRLMRYFTPRFLVADTLEGVVADPDNFATDEMVTRYWELLRMAGSRDASIKRFSESHLEPSLEPLLRAVDPATLLIWGSQDRLIDPKYGIAMNTQIIGSLLKLYPQAGHLAHEEMPEKTAADIRTFLDRALYTE
ncbi:MAG: 2-hydroxy-6-oxononadienedioate/2-hydroxy-6-oxononatrienedioate hydrolase [Alphaproteobacteria bacterium]|nr:MAG: 2-hydroxy-6-oxononadienedioate/2-hydroxy-6-oxononatrienedioate hydrolase [Alphaproteobacteria bacterium]